MRPNLDSDHYFEFVFIIVEMAKFLGNINVKEREEKEEKKKTQRNQLMTFENVVECIQL